MKEFISAVEEVLAEDAAIEDKDIIKFKVDGRELHAHPLSEGQLVFMMAAMGRGQTNDSRFASIINVMLSSLRGNDRDWLESRLLSDDPKERIPVKTIEAIFEHLTEQWFSEAHPTQPSSASAPTEPSIS